MVDKLESERLILRKFELDDAQEMFDNWASDLEVNKFLSWPVHKSVETTKAIIKEWVEEYNDPQVFRYAITLKSSGALIGAIDVVKIVDDVPEIGYCLSRKYWNNGYMTETVKTLINYLNNIGYKKIIIAANKDNIASIRVIEKCGFTFTHQETRTPISRFKEGTAIINHYQLIKN